MGWAIGGRTIPLIQLVHNATSTRYRFISLFAADTVRFQLGSRGVHLKGLKWKNLVSLDKAKAFQEV